MEEDGEQGKPLLPAQAGASAAETDAGRAGGSIVPWMTVVASFVFLIFNSASVVPWMTVVGFVFLTFYSAMAIYRSNGYWGEVAFVVFCVCLVTLFLCLRRLERPPPGSAARGKLKAVVLTMVRAVISSFMAAGIMQFPVQLLVWAMAVAIVVGGFYAFFIHWERKGQTERGVVLATLRSQLPGEEGGSRANDPRDTAWIGARFIVDSGATRHAVGNIRLLVGFHPYSSPLVAMLADGSYLRILGTGHIQRGNFRIPNVLLIEGLRDGLISTPQLDTEHGLISCFGNGICRIMETDGTEVGGAILEGGSYVLRFLNVPGPAQVQGR